MIKKLSLLVLITVGSAHLSALPLGNPTEASFYTEGVWLCQNENCWSVRTGFYGDYTYNRHMRVASGGEITTTERFTNGGIVVLNIANRLDCFSTLGATNISFIGDPNAFPGNNSPLTDEIRLFLKTQFSWSVGARATLWEQGAFGLGIEGEYFRCAPPFDRFIDMSSALAFPIENQVATYSEWQVGLGASYNFSTPCSTIGIVPYLDIAWSSARLVLNDFLIDRGLTEVVLSELRSSKPWTYAVGATILLRDSLGITVEGRFAGEKAVHVNGQIRF